MTRSRLSGRKMELRPCEGCGYARRVVMNTFHLVGEDPRPTWKKLCTACDLDRSARVHRAVAAALSARAAEIRAKRARGR